VIIFAREVIIRPAGAVCVAVMARLLITFFFIVLLWVFSGTGLFRPLGSIGFFLGQLLIFFLAGGMV
jgi:hypothetical protein